MALVQPRGGWTPPPEAAGIPSLPAPCQRPLTLHTSDQGLAGAVLPPGDTGPCLGHLWLSHWGDPGIEQVGPGRCSHPAAPRTAPRRETENGHQLWVLSWGQRAHEIVGRGGRDAGVQSVQNPQLEQDQDAGLLPNTEAGRARCSLLSSLTNPCGVLRADAEGDGGVTPRGHAGCPLRGSPAGPPGCRCARRPGPAGSLRCGR